jgi:hypothetical protein
LDQDISLSKYKEKERYTEVVSDTMVKQIRLAHEQALSNSGFGAFSTKT